MTSKFLAVFLSFTVAAMSSAQVLQFNYTQEDATTGSGTIAGVVDGIAFLGDLPPAVVQQIDTSDLEIPDGIVGYMNGWSSSNPGNDFGVHIGWEGSFTLGGERIISATEVELVQIEIPFIIDDAGSPDANWTYEVDLTDDGGNGNDSFGTGLRLAGFVGDPADGHRHSADAFGDFVKGEVDTRTVSGGFGAVGNSGRGDALGIAISLRDANGSSGPMAFQEFEDDDGDTPGPIYVDRVSWTGGLSVPSDAEVTSVGVVPLADLNGNGTVEFQDFLILRDNFNLEGTDRSTGDLNGDQFTGLRDFALFRAAFAAGSNVAAASVPEPNSLLFVFIGAIGLAAVRRKRS